MSLAPTHFWNGALQNHPKPPNMEPDGLDLECPIDRLFEPKLPYKYLLWHSSRYDNSARVSLTSLECLAWYFSRMTAMNRWILHLFLNTYAGLPRDSSAKPLLYCYSWRSHVLALQSVFFGKNLIYKFKIMQKKLQNSYKDIYLTTRI